MFGNSDCMGALLQVCSFSAGMLRGMRAQILLDDIDQLTNYLRLSQCRHIPELLGLGFVVGNLAQYAAHNLATARLGQAGHDDEVVGHRDGTDTPAHLQTQLVAQLALCVVEAVLQAAVREQCLAVIDARSVKVRKGVKEEVRHLPFEFVRHSYDCSLRAAIVRD